MEGGKSVRNWGRKRTWDTARQGQLIEVGKKGSSMCPLKLDVFRGQPQQFVRRREGSMLKDRAPMKVKANTAAIAKRGDRGDQADEQNVVGQRGNEDQGHPRIPDP